ncbi:DUF6233 domain-containing protein [Streptomyces bobili]|uniref:DUF6233 domain-containing protein n=1 Tax=Streptomyces bobili TaxID=67280 RepID=UPI0034239108
MNDSVSQRLAQLRFLERVQVGDLARTRHWIAEEERRKAEQQRGALARPPAPDWLLEHGLNGHSPPVYVHVGTCWNAGKRSKGISQDAARRALAEGVTACPQCRPDTALGYVEG